MKAGGQTAGCKKPPREGQHGGIQWMRGVNDQPLLPLYWSFRPLLDQNNTMLLLSGWAEGWVRLMWG